MTYDQLVREVAGRTTQLNKGEIDTLVAREHISLNKVENILRTAFEQIHTHVLENNGEIAIPGFGRFIVSLKRSNGVKPNGTRWTAEPRKQLSFRASRKASVRDVKPTALTESDVAA